MNANKQDAGGLLPCPGCGKSDLDHCPADFVAVNGLTRGMIVRCAWCHFAAPEAAWNRRELCRADPPGGDVECFVREMRTSKGAEFFVVVKRDGRELTPHMYTERWKAEYDVASWQHLLCGAPEPDLLAYGPSDVSAPAGSGEVSRLELAKMELAVTAALFNYEQGDTVSEWLKNTAALLRKLQQGAE